MDEQVLRGMAKWPNVPAVYGWLALDRRGRWLIKGDRIDNPVIVDFIGRNYESDAGGAWFFQNGPQRVFVELEYTPFVFRATSAGAAPLELAAHTGAKVAAVRGAFMDEAGAILVDTDVGFGVVDGRDLDAVVAAFVDSSDRHPSEEALERMIERAHSGSDTGLRLRYHGAHAPLGSLRSPEAPQRFGYDPHPAAPAGHPECN